MLKYTIPLYYTYKSRLKTNSEKIAYIFTFLVPVIFNGLLNIEKKSIENSILLFFSILLCMGIYEIGYILNDTITIKKEKNPTLRLAEMEIKYIQINIKKILFLKVIISSFIYIFLNLFIQISLIKYIIVVLTILGSYYIHNNFRNNKVTYVTFFLLSTLRFFTPIYLLINGENKILYLLISTVLLFSLIRNIEEIGHKKYFIGNLNIFVVRHEFRVVYYLILLLLSYFLSKYFKIDIKNFQKVLYYLVFYRVIIYILLKLKNKIKKGKK